MSQKKELAVSALRAGTVIDHIPARALFKAVRLLGLENCDKAVTIGSNLPSGHLGTKGIIKVADTVFPPEVLNRIAIIAFGAVVNIIEDYAVVSKQPVSLPAEIVDLVRCTNPKCVTNNQPIRTRFDVVDPAAPTLRCHYCDHEVSGDSIILK